MKWFILLLLFNMHLLASLLDFKYLSDAKQAYNDKNYTKAGNFYGKVKSDEAKFNQANSLYRQKKYKKAIEAYKSINDSKLKAKSLHNIGNSYAKMSKIDEAIKSYEEALKIADDTDTRFNLEFLKKKKKKQEKKKQEKKKQEKKKQEKKQDKKNKKDQSKKDQSKKDQSKQDQSKQDQKNSDKDKSGKQKSEDKKEKDKSKSDQKEKKVEQNQAKMAEQNQTQPPISNMEERKWQKMLNKRGVNTLMIPLNKGDRKNETNLW